MQVQLLQMGPVACKVCLSVGLSVYHVIYLILFVQVWHCYVA